MKKADALSTKLGHMALNNPVLSASGTFSVDAVEKYMDPNILGAVVLKSITLNPRKGNNTPRIAEVYGGMLNCVGLQNNGLETFVQADLPVIRNKLEIPLIVSIAGSSLEDYVTLTERLEAYSGINALEINTSCPNTNTSGKVFCENKKEIYTLVKSLRKITKRDLIIKLTPNKANIVEMAIASEQAGADAVCVANTILGMKIDIASRKPLLSNIVGGFSGPAVKPIILRMVFEVYQAIQIPIVGVGGIESTEDVLEYMLAGATAVQVGTASFENPYKFPEIIDGLTAYAENQGLKNLHELVGMAHQSR